MGAGRSSRKCPSFTIARVAGLSKYGILNRLGRGISGLALVRRCLKGQVPATKRLKPPGRSTVSNPQMLLRLKTAGLKSSRKPRRSSCYSPASGFAMIRPGQNIQPITKKPSIWVEMPSGRRYTAATARRPSP